MNDHLKNIVLNVTDSRSIIERKVIQTLWSGYGEIVRLKLADGKADSVVVKSIVFPDEQDHPRGWNSERSHMRKVHSYDVEMNWYRQWGERCGDQCRVAHCYATYSNEQEHALILEDLDLAGYSLRKSELNRQEVGLCLAWLANFHANFMNETPEGLWPIGSYWHLETRPDEWAAMEEGELKQAASAIDALLNNAQYKTLIHGDAKVANFCFSKSGGDVAAVDFQYIGGGCGMKDVAYLLGSCLSEQACEQWQDELLDEYFLLLRQALSARHKAVDLDALESEWRRLFPLAWVDFYRFLLGWMPGHWKENEYSRGMAKQVLAQLG